MNQQEIARTGLLISENLKGQWGGILTENHEFSKSNGYLTKNIATLQNQTKNN